MQYRTHRLDNGLEVLAECNPAARSVSCGFFVRTGARDERPEINGVSHFLEHMVFKGTTRRSAADVNRELDEMGSHSNALTSEESTIYHASVLPDFQDRVVELFADIMRPALRAEDFETERQVILEEILMYDDQPPYGGYEKAMRAWFGNHPLSQPVLGTTETVSAMTPEAMRAWFEERYSPSNMAFAVAGKVDFERLVETLDRHCGSWKPFPARRNCPLPAGKPGRHVLHKPDSVQEYVLQIAPGPGADDPDRYAVRVLTTIFGDDSGSRIFWEFLDTGLAESAGTGNHEYLNAGTVMTYLSCAPEQTAENLVRLQQLQESILTRPVTDHELALAKSKISSHILLSGERTESRMFSVGSQWLRGHAYQSPREIARRYEAITLEAVNAVAAKYPMTESATLCVGPLDSWPE
jgi:predicted Zn-dependent peptidase